MCGWLGLLLVVVTAAGIWYFLPRRQALYAGVKKPIVEFLTTELKRFPLHQAVFQNDFSAVQRLLQEGHSIEEETDDGQTVLHIAAECGLEEMCRFVIKHGVKVNALDNFGGTALHAASACQSGVGVIRVLIESGADAQLKDAAGMTPGALAEKYKHFKIAAYLKLRGSYTAGRR